MRELWKSHKRGPWRRAMRELWERAVRESYEGAVRESYERDPWGSCEGESWGRAVRESCEGELWGSSERELHHRVVNLEKSARRHHTTRFNNKFEWRTLFSTLSVINNHHRSLIRIVKITVKWVLIESEQCLSLVCWGSAASFWRVMSSFHATDGQVDWQRFVFLELLS